MVARATARVMSERLEGRMLMCFDTPVHVQSIHAGGDFPIGPMAAVGETGLAVVSFTLYDADTDRPIPGYESMTGGTVEMNLSAMPRRIALTANPGSTPLGSVKLRYDSTTKTENGAPYALPGDDDGNLLPFAFSTGTHALSATPYSGRKLTGTAGPTLAVQLVVKKDGGTTTTNAGSNTFAWSTQASAPLARYEAQGLALGGKLYVMGGFYNADIKATKRVDIYDPATNTWSRGAAMPEALTHAGAAAVGRSIYLAGGFIGNHPGPSTRHVWRYDVDANAWTRGPDLPADRAGGGLVLLGSELHFYGGGVRPAGSGGIPTDYGTHWALDLNNPGGGWQSRADMPTPRNHIGYAALGGRAYAVGGQKNENEVSGNRKEVHAYDPATNSWTRLADLPRAVGHISSSTFEMDGRIVVAGGVTQDKKALSAVIAYDPRTGDWSALPSLPSTRKSPVADVIGGKLIVTGGSSSGSNVQVTTWSGTLAGKWYKGASMPTALGEVAGGIVGKKLYLVGEGGSGTLAYDLASDSWTTGLKTRPQVGHHHAAETLGGKLYLLGGLKAGMGKVQIYNPATNAWSLGADIPFAAGSGATAVIGGKIYFAGGIVGASTTDRAAVYDPATNLWTPLPAMPRGVNHAAAATDGQRLYVFGGRAGGNTVTDGYDVVQIFDPATGQWQSSLDPASGIPALPQPRGGMGKAVFANGVFHVIGGETKTGAGATSNNVYNRVDIYDPAARTWRLGPALPTARHGIFPLPHNGRILVAGGGVRAANSQSSVTEILYLG